jgi:hypothetical protein
MGIRTLRTLTFNSICEMNVLSLLICTYLPCPSDASQWSYLALRFHGRREQPEESRCETRSKSAENLQCLDQSGVQTHHLEATIPEWNFRDQDVSIDD